MKKLLFGLFSVLFCGIALADVKVVNDINDKGKIYWEAFDAAGSALNSELVRNNLYEYFTEHANEEFAAKDILKECKIQRRLAINKGLVKEGEVNCGEFVREYYKYIGGDAYDCEFVSGLIKTNVKTEANSFYVNDLKDLKGRCSLWEKGAGDWDYVNGERVIVGNGRAAAGYEGDVCFRAMDHLKKCTRYLESYYTKELEKKDTSILHHVSKMNSCILRRIQTGQMELPVKLMERYCGR